jgi:hypothetical protein
MNPEKVDKVRVRKKKFVYRGVDLEQLLDMDE